MGPEWLAGLVLVNVAWDLYTDTAPACYGHLGWGYMQEMWAEQESTLYVPTEDPRLTLGEADRY
jgi:hypothetical protein